MRNKDQQLLEEAYLKILGEDFNSDRRFNAFAQNLESRGFKVIYRDPTSNGEVYVFYNAKTNDQHMSIGDRVQSAINKTISNHSMSVNEFIFIEVDASKNFVSGYVLTTDSYAGPKIVKFLNNDERGAANLGELLDNIRNIDAEIMASAMHPIKSYQDAFTQINSRDRQYAEV